MRVKVLGFIAVAVGLIVLAVERAQSQAPDDRPPRQSAEAPQPGGAFRLPTPPVVEALDANRDGELTDDELDKAESALKSLDKNNDGALDDEELGGQVQFGGPGGGRGGRGGRGGPGARQPQKVLEQFDANKDGMLDRDERPKAREFAKKNRPVGGRGGFFGGGGPGGPGGGAAPPAGAPNGRGGGPGGPGGGPGANNVARQPGERLAPDDVKKYPDGATFYDANVLRTIFFEFENKDWEEELEDFHATDVDVPARMIVDGKAYDNVGLRFRGTSSYGGVPRGQKRSLNVTVDLADKKQNLYGYKTLNLLNSHTDPSFLRSVLYSHIARHYIPAPAANLVRVVINGENWGVYINEEQYNQDFVRKWFGDGDGPRWKVPPNFSGAAALVYHGDDAAEYRGMYEIKAKNEDQAWRDLIALCKKLQDTPDDKLETELAAVLDIDRALWFLALDNVLGDGDGYFSRGSDYVIYQDTQSKRFHILPRDSNETFRSGGGPGGPGGAFGRRGGPGGRGDDAGPGGRGGQGDADVLIVRGQGGDASGDAGRAAQRDPERGGPGGGPGQGGGTTQDPLAQLEASNRPLVTKLLNNKRLRARYLAHVRTIVDEWLSWEKLGPVFEDYRALIAEDVIRDTRNLSTFAEFFDSDTAGAGGGGPFGGPPGIKRFVEERRAYLLKHPELSKAAPKIIAADARMPKSEGDRRSPAEAVVVEARVSNSPPVDGVFLHYSPGRNTPFQRLEMRPDEKASSGQSDETVYVAAIPSAEPGIRVRYYVEAQAAGDIGTASFSPPGAEFATYDFRVPVAGGEPGAKSKTPAVVINELMAVNNRTIKDPQGKFADWIELLNTGSEEADLSGLHLTTSKDKPRKWKFPGGTKLAPGERLIVWADSDSKAKPGIHANFKLAKSGEAVYLTDRDERGNAILDAVEFGEQRADVAWGRFPEGSGKWQLLPPTPGAPNVPGK